MLPISCNYDIFNRWLLSSDPFITGIRPKPKRRTNAFLSETLEMLLPDDPETLLAEDVDEQEDLMLESFSDEEPWMASSD
ncbi:hypothetical protein ILUMI_24393 [Ignelater luminosus]|uniref:Uncharacterized protein n=1 Tax=Ignelater luminosus TaxID=2038154 RepID=A0A8K0CC20_IGNLU|nr:hypothetical protein ILUMI_24393 [Ignelater luminosus]